MNKLANDLLDFDFLSAQSKVELWLTYRGEKQASLFPFLSEFRENTDKEKEFGKWVKEAGLQTKDINTLWVVAKEQKTVEELEKIVFSNEEKNVVRKAELYGYPAKTAGAYFRSLAKVKEWYPQGTAINKMNAGGISWWPYVRYVVRLGKEMEDSQVAKRWQEIIRKDIPELDEAFVKEIGGAE